MEKIMIKDMNIHKEEMNIHGFSDLGQLLTAEQVDFFRNDLLEHKEKHIQKHGSDKLNKYGELEMLRNVGSFHPKYLELLESSWFNGFINSVLNEKAILHGYHGILTTGESNGVRSLPLRFHRDAPWFKDTRTCVLLLMPLLDFVEEVGPTEYVPGTHLFENMPSQEFLERHAKRMIVPAGTVLAMDGTLWHRAGANKSGKIRPMLQMNITLAFMKQQIDVWQGGTFQNCSDLVKSRLGYNVRTYKDPDEMFSDNRNWKSGNYDIANIRIR
jgi:ectoine hydroxylase-related dioxygenase (phytanoyl-CoA dioxygenase family)